jgi:hypothetical protein
VKEKAISDLQLLLERIGNRLSEYFPDDKITQEDLKIASCEIGKLQDRKKDAEKYETAVIPRMARALFNEGFNTCPDETVRDIIEFFNREDNFK